MKKFNNHCKNKISYKKNLNPPIPQKVGKGVQFHLWIWGNLRGVATTRRNCEAAFRAASIFPIDPDGTVLQRTDVRQSTPFDAEPEIRGININSKEITTQEMRIEIASKYHGKTINSVNEIPKTNENEIIIRQNTYSTEKLLSDFPVSIVEVQGNTAIIQN